MLKDSIEKLFIEAINSSIKEGKLGAYTSHLDEVPVELPKNPEHGDRAISIAMKLTKESKMQPRLIAETIVANLNKSKFSKIDIAGPGFINISLSWDLLEDCIVDIHRAAENYGRSLPENRPDKNYDSLLIEFVSANPTGDLHLGHGHQGVVGSALASILQWAGYKVSCEFYINDAGAQIEKLAKSAQEASLVQAGLMPLDNYDSDNNYPIESMLEFIKFDKSQEELSKMTREEFGQIAKQIFLQSQKDILKEARIEYDNWYSEIENLHQKDSSGKSKVDLVCERLFANGAAYELDEALWFKAKDFGDERDRVLRKSDGKYTYLAADLAYHGEKLARGFGRLINLWGADHHGQIPGIKGGLKALGFDENKLEVVLLQLVSLVKSGEEVKMSKRDGNFVTVRELIKEVGVDAFRYFLAESSGNTRIVFDLELAQKRDKDNPVYYVQYAHARCSSILRTLTGVQLDTEEKKILEPVITEEELKSWRENFKSNQNLFEKTFGKIDDNALKSTKALILGLANFPEIIKDAALSRAPYKIATYLKEIAVLFHQFYTYNRVIIDDKELMQARVSLVIATQITVSNALGVLGLSSPERM